jgi:hypothetical protein
LRLTIVALGYIRADLRDSENADKRGIPVEMLWDLFNGMDYVYRLSFKCFSEQTSHLTAEARGFENVCAPDALFEITRVGRLGLVGPGGVGEIPSDV